MTPLPPEALEAAARAIEEARDKVHSLFGGYDYSSYGRKPPYVVKDERTRQAKIIWEGDDHEESGRQYHKAVNNYIARAAILAFLSSERAAGRAMMPRDPDAPMIVAGVAERHGQPVPEAWSLATENVWRAMFDSAPTEGED